MNSCEFRMTRDGLNTVVYLSDPVSLSAMQTFAQTLKNFSQAKLTYQSFTQGAVVEDDTQGDGDYSNIGLIAKVFMRDQDDQETWEVPIPSPTDSMLDADQEVTPVAGAEIALAYKLLTGKNVLFEHGALAGKVRNQY